jgi:hypothetical protein
MVARVTTARRASDPHPPADCPTRTIRSGSTFGRLWRYATAAAMSFAVLSPASAKNGLLHCP